MPSYEVYLYSNTGVLLKTLTKRITRLTWRRKVNDVGDWSLTLSDRATSVDASLFQLNGRVAIYRKATPFDTAKLEMLGFIRGWDYSTDNRGVTRYTWTGPDQNDLLASRICFPLHPYTDGFWAPNHYGYADNLMRELVEDNLGAGSSNPATRDVVTSNTAGLTIAIESSATATRCTTAGRLWVAATTQSLLEVCQYISWASQTHIEGGVGTGAAPVWFDMALDSNTAMTFRAYSPLRGMNHRANSGNAVYVGIQYANLVEPRWEYDRSKEITAGFAVQPSGSPADTAWALDDTRIGHAPLNRREGGTFASGDTWSSAVGFLNGNNPRPKFSGRLKDTPGCRYGVHWGLGDEISADYLGKQYPVRVSEVSVKCAAGFENIEPTFEVLDA